MVDTGSVVSLITKRIAQEIESHDSSAWWRRQPNSLKLKSFNISPIKNLGTLYCEVQKNGWNSGRVDLIVVSNSYRAIIGRDLFKNYIWSLLITYKKAGERRNSLTIPSGIEGIIGRSQSWHVSRRTNPGHFYSAHERYGKSDGIAQEHRNSILSFGNRNP